MQKEMFFVVTKHNKADTPCKIIFPHNNRPEVFIFASPIWTPCFITDFEFIWAGYARWFIHSNQAYDNLQDAIEKAQQLYKNHILSFIPLLYEDEIGGKIIYSYSIPEIPE